MIDSLSILSFTASCKASVFSDILCILFCIGHFLSVTHVVLSPHVLNSFRCLQCKAIDSIYAGMVKIPLNVAFDKNRF